MILQNHFLTGANAILKGFTYLGQHPRLIVYALLPFLIQLVILISLLSYFGVHTTDLFNWLGHWVDVWQVADPQNIWLKLFNFMIWGIAQLLKIILFLLGILFVSLVGFLIGMIASSPFNDLLSEKTEATLRQTPAIPLSLRYVGRIFLAETVKALIFISVPILLLVLNWIPVVGTIAYLLLSTVFGMWAMGVTFADYTIARHHADIRSRLRFYYQNASAMCGFGLGFLIPFFSFFFSTPLIVGATVLAVELDPN